MEALQLFKNTYQDIHIRETSQSFTVESTHGLKKYTVAQTILFHDDTLNETEVSNLRSCLSLLQEPHTIAVSRKSSTLKALTVHIPDSPITSAVTPWYTMDQLILPEALQQDLQDALGMIFHHKKVYEEWGLASLDPKPSLILNFHGPSGTGKTMSAHAIAHALDKKILLINYSEIASKYVGESSKNLEAAFQMAKAQDAVLFFDEADSFLGKRIENVQGSADQSANALRNQMLMLLEQFQGVVLFATNLVHSYDKALSSRILKHLKFEVPDLPARQRILQRMLPKQAPIDRALFEEEIAPLLAQESDGFSGRDLKNAIRWTFYIAANNEKNTLDKATFIEGFQKAAQQKKDLEQSGRSKASPQLQAAIKQQLSEQSSSTIN
ncbi:ATP-binding protein [Algivirga pacifica]|uniref:AAA+ ATPase domain-containing protein n=1 Tax=Algivirga pacifica TaxID=1162670 RepID=A0ABP9D4T9_9BACT